jgi:hypothetical protein
VDRKFVLPSGGNPIIEALKNVLEAAICLYDEEKRVRHTAMSSWWLSVNGMADIPAGFCHVQARINDRWMLHVFKRPSLHPDAESIAVWAAGKLALHLPRRTADDPTYPPFGGGGGGSSGSAEIGIPIWWARRTRG